MKSGRDHHREALKRLAVWSPPATRWRPSSRPRWMTTWPRRWCRLAVGALQPGPDLPRGRRLPERDRAVPAVPRCAASRGAGFRKLIECQIAAMAAELERAASPRRRAGPAPRRTRRQSEPTAPAPAPTSAPALALEPPDAPALTRARAVARGSARVDAGGGGWPPAWPRVPPARRAQPARRRRRRAARRRARRPARQGRQPADLGRGRDRRPGVAVLAVGVVKLAITPGRADTRARGACRADQHRDRGARSRMARKQNKTPALPPPPKPRSSPAIWSAPTGSRGRSARAAWARSTRPSTSTSTPRGDQGAAARAVEQPRRDHAVRERGARGVSLKHPQHRHGPRLRPAAQRSVVHRLAVRRGRVAEAQDAVHRRRAGIGDVVSIIARPRAALHARTSTRSSTATSSRRTCCSRSRRSTRPTTR
jgi:hypothetical protein